MTVHKDVHEAMAAPEVQEAISEFVASVNEEQPEGQGPTEGTSTPPVSSEGEGPSETETSEEQAPPEAPQGTDDTPLSYMGIDLSDLPPEKRQSVIDAVKEQDKFLNRVLQRNAELEKQAAEQPTQPQVEAPAPEPVEPPTDEQLMALLGYSPEDPMYDVKSEVALPLVKKLVEVSQTVDTLQEEREVEKATQYWNETLDGLETEYGDLPCSRDELLDFAIEHAIYDPVSAYHQVMGPARKVAGDAATKARQEVLEALKKQQEGGVRPRTTGSQSKEPEIKAEKMRDAVKEAAALAAEEAETTWDSALQEFLANQ